MSFTAISNARLTTNEPADEDLFTDLAGNDEWQKTDGTNGGSGIEPTVEAFETAMAAHSHDGTDGQGDPIPAGGLASGAISVSSMIVAGAVDSAELGNSGSDRMADANFADGAVTPAKLSGSMVGYSASGSRAAAMGDLSLSHGLGHRPVIGSVNSNEFYIVSTSSSSVVVGQNLLVGADPWHYDFTAM